MENFIKSVSDELLAMNSEQRHSALNEALLIVEKELEGSKNRTAEEATLAENNLTSFQKTLSQLSNQK